MSTTAYINRIGTARPRHEISDAFIGWAERQLTRPRDQALFRRMAARSGIEKRWSVIPPAPGGSSPVGAGGFYDETSFPGTSTRMAAYADEAPKLALAAIAQLGELGHITHLVVASCTGLRHPGLIRSLLRSLACRARSMGGRWSGSWDATPRSPHCA